MQSLLRAISRCVLLVMLTTVFSPSFAWAAAEAVSAHEHSAQVGHEHHGDAVSADITDASMSQDCDADTQHHCCPGHQLGHMQASLADEMTLPLPQAGIRLSGVATSQFTSHVPSGLERPPKLHSA